MTEVQIPVYRPNPYLRSMFVVGLVLTTLGVVWALIGYSAVDHASGLSDAWLRGNADIAIGAGLASFGVLLLLISWIIAAARFR